MRRPEEPAGVPEAVMRSARAGDVPALEAWFAPAASKDRIDLKRQNAGRFAGAPDKDAAARGSTLLMHAVVKDRLAAARYLLSRGCDPDRTDAWGRAPLHRAAGHGLADAVSLLLRVGARVDARDSRGATPLHLAAATAFARRDEILAACLRRGAAADALDGAGRTAEDVARRHGHARAAALLADVRAAGGWRRHVLGPRLRLVVLRALCGRGRAAAVDAGAVEGRLFRGVPRYVFWRVLGYWRG
jgi:hypothetical protein